MFVSFNGILEEGAEHNAYILHAISWGFIHYFAATIYEPRKLKSLMSYLEKPVWIIYSLISQVRNLTSGRLTGKSIMYQIDLRFGHRPFDIEISALTASEC